LTRIPTAFSAPRNQPCGAVHSRSPIFPYHFPSLLPPSSSDDRIDQCRVAGICQLLQLLFLVIPNPPRFLCPRHSCSFLRVAYLFFSRTFPHVGGSRPVRMTSAILDFSNSLIAACTIPTVSEQNTHTHIREIFEPPIETCHVWTKKAQPLSMTLVVISLSVVVSVGRQYPSTTVFPHPPPTLKHLRQHTAQSHPSRDNFSVCILTLLPNLSPPLLCRLYLLH
jgi:hypothetical protein